MSDKPLHDRLFYLFQRYLDKTYTTEEYEELMQFISQPENDQQVRKLIDEGWHFPLPARRYGLSVPARRSVQH